MNKRLATISILVCLQLMALVSAEGLDGFTGVTEVQQVTFSHPNYQEISQQYSLSASELYEVTYHIKEGWNFLPYPILNGRDAVTGKASCWKQDDQRGNIQATILDYVYMYEPDMAILPDNHVNYYIGGKTEEWDVQPLYDYKSSIWSISEPNKKSTLPINWVYSSVNCDFLFYTRWLDTANYKETTDALMSGNVPCTSDFCPLKLEAGWQVVPQLFPGFAWNEIKGDCLIEEINFWNPTGQSYTIGSNEKQENLDVFMNTKISKQDYFKPILMKVKNDCMLGTPTNTPCQKILDNGASSNNIDIIFIPDNYSALSEWEADVNTLIDLNGRNNGFFSVEPLNSNKDKFNIWRVDSIPNTFENHPVYIYSNLWSRIRGLIGSCGAPNLIVVVTNNKGSATTSGGAAFYQEEEPSSISLYSESGNSENRRISTKVLVHEFGHAFANLGDEYENSVEIMDFSYRPNIDVEGCPKWCSGQLNQTSHCYAEYMGFRDCLYNVTNNLQNPENYQQAPNPQTLCPYPYNAPACDTGVNCIVGTGCYWNAKSIIAFKSSSNSLMAYSEQDPFEFNLISREAIQDKIDEFSS
jgi:hypothetical protein